MQQGSHAINDTFLCRKNFLVMGFKKVCYNIYVI